MHPVLAINEVELFREVDRAGKAAILAVIRSLRVNRELLALAPVLLLQGQVDLIRLADPFAEIVVQVNADRVVQVGGIGTQLILRLEGRDVRQVLPLLFALRRMLLLCRDRVLEVRERDGRLHCDELGRLKAHIVPLLVFQGHLRVEDTPAHGIGQFTKFDCDFTSVFIKSRCGSGVNCVCTNVCKLGGRKLAAFDTNWISHDVKELHSQ